MNTPDQKRRDEAHIAKEAKQVLFGCAVKSVALALIALLLAWLIWAWLERS